MFHSGVKHVDAMRLIVELSSVYVACGHCGRSRVLTATNLQAVASVGAHSFEQLCRKIRCSECPKLPLADRSLTIRPSWLPASQSIA